MGQCGVPEKPADERDGHRLAPVADGAEHAVGAAAGARLALLAQGVPEVLRQAVVSHPEGYSDDHDTYRSDQEWPCRHGHDPRRDSVRAVAAATASTEREEQGVDADSPEDHHFDGRHQPVAEALANIITSVAEAGLQPLPHEQREKAGRDAVQRNPTYTRSCERVQGAAPRRRPRRVAEGETDHQPGDEEVDAAVHEDADARKAIDPVTVLDLPLGLVVALREIHGILTPHVHYPRRRGTLAPWA